MPISLRLPLEIESQITGFSTRTGVTKSAVIVRSIQEFLAKHAVPTSAQIYEEAMRGATSRGVSAVGSSPSDERELLEPRPLKLQVRKALRSKHAERSARATQVLAVPQNKAVKSR
jgi:hypothetical protein